MASPRQGTIKPTARLTALPGPRAAPSICESIMCDDKRKAIQVSWLADVAKVIGAITLLLRTLHEINLL